MPARVENVEKIMRSGRRNYISQASAKTIAAQARRTGWRNIKDWIDAQIALIETEMVTVQEVFLPYVVMGENTLYERFESGQLQLGTGN